MIKKIKNRFDGNTKELIKHGKNYISASLLTKGLSIISIPIMTRLLTTSEYGIISVFTTLVSFLVIIDGLGIRSAVTRYYYEDKESFPNFYSMNAIFLWIAGIIISIFLVLISGSIARAMNIPKRVVFFAIATSFGSATFNYVSAYLRAAKKSKALSSISVIRAVFVIGITILITINLSTDMYYGSIYAQLAASIILFLLSMKYILRNGVNKFKRDYLKYALIIGFPVMLHLLSNVILKSFDQLMINKMIDSTATGLYSFAYKVGMIFQLFVNGLNQSWTPIMYDKMGAEKYDEINVTVRRFASIISAIAILLVFFAPILVRILAPREYIEALSLVPIVLIGFIFQYMYLMYVIYAFYSKNTKAIAIVTVFCGALNILLNYFFIPKFGYEAAAWTTMVTYLIFFILHYMNVRVFIKPKAIIPLKIILKPCLFAIGVIIIHFLFNGRIESTLLLALIDLSMFVFFIMLIRKNI